MQKISVKYKISIIGGRFKIYIASFAFLILLIFSFDLFEIKTLSKLFSYQVLEGLVITEAEKEKALVRAAVLKVCLDILSSLELLEGVGVEGAAEI